jgi:hypothetical protein
MCGKQGIFVLLGDFLLKKAYLFLEKAHRFSNRLFRYFVKLAPYYNLAVFNVN